jgi:hypothetical protein
MPTEPQAQVQAPAQPHAGRVFDVCNGDADGLCAALQWRLHAPQPATLVTGLKRDIALLDRVPARDAAEVNVFDLSMRRNHDALLRLLQAGVRVRYFDHHAPGDIPSHDALQAHIDTTDDVCTSLLVDRHLQGASRAWALVGAYGDNLSSVADLLAGESGIGPSDRAALRRLGEAMNYNAYGDHESDVCIAPAKLYEVLSRYRDPRDMLARETVADDIDAMRRDDLAQAVASRPHWQDARGSVHLLPDAPWSRRVLGSFANHLGNAEPQRAHALLKSLRNGGYLVSVRAPLTAPSGAGDLCMRFGGGGRARAGGIDALPESEVERFIAEFASTRWGTAAGGPAGRDAGAGGR